ncbi:MAG: hypothetical protein QHJ73_18150, partial [Armatimonadota bacterium]|nr:hypothetical protein [Armatimonadota bacterium]
TWQVRRLEPPRTCFWACKQALIRKGGLVGGTVRLQLRPTRKVLVALGGIALLSAGMAAMAVRVNAAQRARKQATLEAKQRERDRILAEAAELDNSRARLAQLRYRLSVLRPCKAEDYQPSLLVELTELAQSSGILVSSFTPREVPPDQPSPVTRLGKSGVAPHRFQTINGGLQGTYHDVCRFLYRLTGLPKIVSVDSLQMQPAPGGAQDVVRATFQITAYIPKEIDPRTTAAVLKLREIADAQVKYQKDAHSFTDLNGLAGAGLISLREKESLEGYVFTTESATKDQFKVKATTSEADLHNLSIDHTMKVKDETTGMPFD